MSSAAAVAAATAEVAEVAAGAAVDATSNGRRLRGLKGLLTVKDVGPDFVPRLLPMDGVTPTELRCAGAAAVVGFTSTGGALPSSARGALKPLNLPPVLPTARLRMSIFNSGAFTALPAQTGAARESRITIVCIIVYAHPRTFSVGATHPQRKNTIHRRLCVTKKLVVEHGRCKFHEHIYLLLSKPATDDSRSSSKGWARVLREGQLERSLVQTKDYATEVGHARKN